MVMLLAPIRGAASSCTLLADVATNIRRNFYPAQKVAEASEIAAPVRRHSPSPLEPAKVHFGEEGGEAWTSPRLAGAL